MSEELSIKLNIGDRVYPLRIDPAEEEALRQAARLVTEKLKDYQGKYAVKDKQDLLAMCSLEYATEVIKLRKNKISQDTDIHEGINELADFVTKAMQ
jgi:cell division protein ZapA (FtsZ GTPase activity inhibitor)